MRSIFKMPGRLPYKEEIFIIFFHFYMVQAIVHLNGWERMNTPGKTHMANIWLGNVSCLNLEYGYFWSSGNLNKIKLSH